MRQFCCECGFSVKWTSITGETPQLILDLIDEDHLLKGHEEVTAWEATKIRNEAQKRSPEGRARERASYWRRKELSMGPEGKTTDPQRKVSTK